MSCRRAKAITMWLLMLGVVGAGAAAEPQSTVQGTPAIFVHGRAEPERSLPLPGDVITVAFAEGQQAPAVSEQVSARIAEALDRRGFRVARREEADFALLIGFGTKAIEGEDRYVHFLAAAAVDLGEHDDEGKPVAVWRGEARLALPDLRDPEVPLAGLFRLGEAVASILTLDVEWVELGPKDASPQGRALAHRIGEALSQDVPRHLARSRSVSPASGRPPSCGHLSSPFEVVFCSLLQGGRRDGVMVGRKLLAKGVAVAKIDEVMIRHGLAHPLGEWSKSVIETSTEKSKAALERSYVVPVAGIQGVQATQVQVRYRPRTGQVVLRFPLPPSDCLPSTGRGASGRWKAPRPLEPAVWQPATARREPFANRKALPEKLAVQLMVRADGSVGSVCESIVYGYEPGDRSPNRRRLGIIADRRAAVLAEVETWRFEAAIVDGQPAATSYTLFVQLWPREEPKQSR